MLHSLNDILGQAAIERVTLLVNHVLTSEPVATQRLRPHAGRRIRLHFDGWPGLLPPLPATRRRSLICASTSMPPTLHWRWPRPWQAPGPRST